MNTFIVTQIKVPGTHQWENAPQEVGFLRDLHRHMFTFKLMHYVMHDDRDMEFFIVQRAMMDHICNTYDQSLEGYQFGYRSCEMLAKEMLQSFPYALHCEVWEDDENGAIVEREESEEDSAVLGGYQ